MQIQARPHADQGINTALPTCGTVDTELRYRRGRVAAAAQSLGQGQDQAGGKPRNSGGEIFEPKSSQRPDDGFANVTVDRE